MAKRSRGKKGQFSIIAALFVSAILVTSVVMNYAMINYSSMQESPKILSSIGAINSAIKSVLGFTVGYYGSIIQVTGNRSYAQNLASSYLQSGIVSIARAYPELNPSIAVESSSISTQWFSPVSYSLGNISVTYSLTGVGIEDIKFKTASSLQLTVLESINEGEARIRVTREDNQPELRLGTENFNFYSYSYSASKWTLVPPESSPLAYSNGTYLLQIPSGVNTDTYVIQVADQRGLLVSAFYSEAAVASGVPAYSYTFLWNSSLYASLTTDTIVVEALQNGTLRWLDHTLIDGSPFPPISVKGVHVSVNADMQHLMENQVPFQVEDWSSNYRVPLGLTSNASIFNSRTMLVCLANHDLQNVTFWWDGRDTASLTPYATTNLDFNDNPFSDPMILDNGILQLDVHNFWIESSVVGGTEQGTAEFLRINGDKPSYGAAPAPVIFNGIVRDIVQQEAEWSGGIVETQNLYVDGFDWTTSQWDLESGSSPYLDDSNSYILDNDDLNLEGWFSFQDLSLTGGQLTNVQIQFESRCSGWSSTDEYFDFQIDNGTQVFGYYLIDPPSSYGWRTYDLSGIIDTVEEINNARLRVRYRYNSGSARNVYIRRCRLVVDIRVPNVYAQIVVTLPANATYYTYAARTIFVNSLQSRVITDLSAIQLSVTGGLQHTENGTSGGYPVVSNATGLFYNFSSPTGWAHHWSEFIIGTSGAGLMFTDHQKLYAFDDIAGNKTGALNILSAGRIIEVNPVEQYLASFTYPLDLTWKGAVVTFGGEPIYPESGGSLGLWVLVEHPPTVTKS